MKTLEILIPTYQRLSFLQLTLDVIARQLRQIEASARPKILISDNGSTDGTAIFIESFREKNPDINLRIIKIDRNRGMEENFAVLLEKATSDFIVFSSDDDHLGEGYLQFVVDLIQSDVPPGTIVPGITDVLLDGSQDDSPRQFPFEIKHFEPGVKTARYMSHFFSQMSGLVFRNDRSLVNRYLSSNWRNVYPFVFFGTALALQEGATLAPRFCTLVLQDNVKAWKYPEDGFIDMVLRNFRILELPTWTRSAIEMEFVKYQTFRLAKMKEMNLPNQIRATFRMKSPSLITKLYLLAKAQQC